MKRFFKWLYGNTYQIMLDENKALRRELAFRKSFVQILRHDCRDLKTAEKAFRKYDNSVRRFE